MTCMVRKKSKSDFSPIFKGEVFKIWARPYECQGDFCLFFVLGLWKSVSFHHHHVENLECSLMLFEYRRHRTRYRPKRWSLSSKDMTDDGTK